MPTVTREQVTDALKTMRVVVETVHDVGRVPSGAIYATLMDRMDLSAYEKMVALIVGTGLVRLENHELVWVG